MNENEENAKTSIDSASLQKIVFSAFTRQINRGQTKLNGKLDEKEIEKFCILDEECKGILDSAINRFNLSHRSIQKIKKLSRTIADIEGNENISKTNLLEALSFRKI